MTLPALSGDKLQELDRLAREIRDSQAGAEAMQETFQSQWKVALAEAVLCGIALEKARKLCEPGTFLSWLAGNCPGLDEGQASKYMRLAKPGVLKGDGGAIAMLLGSSGPQAARRVEVRQ
jgi:hypothetical protein